METPQELEVWYIIPTIRRELAIAMKKSGMKQVEIAEKLGVTKASITQYLNNKRASQIKFNDNILSKINISAEKIKTKIDTMREMQIILNLIRNGETICELHRKLDQSFANCGVCKEINLVSIAK